MISCLSFLNAQSQSVATPAASSTGKAAESNVNYSNGTAAISYPIHTISELDLNLPISLSYQTGGIRVTDVASDVGLGWSLNVGGSIHRSVRGLPDEMDNNTYKGYLVTKGDPDYCEDCLKNDTEPDIFMYNVGGYSGKFILNPDELDNVIKITQSDLNISYKVGLTRTSTFNYSSDQIYLFTVVLPTGEVFEFGYDCNDLGGRKPYARDIIVQYAEDNFTPVSAFTQSWHLTKILSNHENQIDFIYAGSCEDLNEVSKYNNYSLRTEKTDVAMTSLRDPKSCPFFLSDSLEKSVVYSSRIKSIQSPFTKIEFVEGERREDLLGQNNYEIKAVNVFKIKNGTWSCHNKYNLDTDYFISNEEGLSNQNNPNNWIDFLPAEDYPDMKRLRLNSITEISCEEEFAYTTSFDYYQDEALPRRLSHSQDLWGYHNGEYDNRSLLPKVKFISDCSSTLDLTSATCLSSDRNVHFESAILGSLKQINYPNGNFQEFILESNTINADHFSLDEAENKISGTGCSNSSFETIIFHDIELDFGIEKKMSISIFDSSCNSLGGDISTIKRLVKIYHKKSSANSSMYQKKLEVELKMSNNREFVLFKNELIDLLDLSTTENNDLKFEVSIPDQNLLLINTQIEISDYQVDNSDFEVGGLRIKEIKNIEGSVHYDYSWDQIIELDDEEYPQINVNLNICNECGDNGGGNGNNCSGYLIAVEKNVTIPCGFSPELKISYDSFDDCNNPFTILTFEWTDVNNGNSGFEKVDVLPGDSGEVFFLPNIQTNRTYDFKFSSTPMGGGQEYLEAEASLKLTNYHEYDFPNPDLNNSSGTLISVPTNVSIKKSFGNTQIDNVCISNDFDIFTLHGNSNVALQTMNGSHIVYGNVKETVLDGSAGSTLYSFSTKSKMFDQHFYKNYLDPLFPVHIYSPATQDVFIEPEFGSLQSIQQLDAKDNVVQRIEYNYLTSQSRLNFKKEYKYNTCDTQEVDHRSSYFIMKSTILPSKTITIRDGVSMVSELSYDPELRHHNPLRTDAYNLIDANDPLKWRYSETKYAHESNRQDLIDANIISIPLETLVQGGAGGGSQNLLVFSNNILYNQGSKLIDNSGNWIFSSEVLERNSEGQVTKIQKRSLPKPNSFVYEEGLIISSRYQVTDTDFTRESTYIYDNLRRLQKKIDPNGIWTSYEYDGLHRLKVVKSKGKPGGSHLIETEYTYTTDPNGPEFLTTTTSYPNSSPAIEDQTTIEEYDDLGRKVKTTRLAYTQSGSDYSTSIFYDKFGRVELSCDPAKGGCDYFKYEDSPLSRVISVKPGGSPKEVLTSYGTNGSWEFGQGAGGFFIQTVTNENGQTVIAYKDVFGKKIATKNAIGDATTYLYNDRQQQTEVIPPGSTAGDPLVTYRYEYNNLSLLEKKHIPGKAGPYVYTYHPDHDFLIQEDLPNGHSLSYLVDDDYPSFTRQVLLDMQVINTFTPVDLDKNNWVQQEEVAILEQGGTLVSAVTSFDEFGKVLTETQEYLDAPISTFTYTYDVLDNLLSYQNNHGGQVVKKTMEYDKGLRLLTTIADFPGFNGVKLNEFNYDNKDWMNSKNIGDLQKMAYGYNPRGWLKSINSVESTFDEAPPECDDTDLPDCEREEIDDSHRVAHLQYNSADLSNGTPTNVVVWIQSFYTASNGSTYGNEDEIIIPFNGGGLEMHASYTDDETFYIDSSEESAAYQDIVASIISSTIGEPTAVEYQEITNLITAVELYETAAMNGPQAPGGPSGSGNYGDGNLFGMEIYYFDGNGDLNALPQYSGNISWMEWRVKEEITQSYGFQYDDLNRLTYATYKGIDEIICEEMPEGAYDVSIGDYDVRGNIRNITRNGVTAWPNPFDLPIYGQIDNIKMGYIGNQLNDVTETALIDRGFKSAGGSPVFTNGNQTMDPAFGMDIMYNFMNLPTLIEEDGDKMEMVYDANGTKLKMTKTVNSVVEETIYAGEFEYINGDIKSIYHEEGRVVYQSIFPFVQGPQDYIEWQISDHLGNVRVRFTDRDNDGEIIVDKEDPLASEVIGSYHYYPFGMKMEGPWLLQQGEINKHQYNGIETFDEFASGIGLTTYRIHDPALGRWLQIDPKAEAGASHTPYNAMWNNPITSADPNGDFALEFAAVSVGVNGLINTAKGNSFFDGWAGAALGGGLSGGIGSAIGSAISGHLPSANIGLGGGFNLSLSPALAFGSNGFSLSGSVGLSYSSKGFSAGVGISGGYTNMSLGDNIAKGWTASLGGGFSIGGAKNNIGLYSNETFGAGIGQRVGGFRGTIGGVSVAYENDGAPFPKKWGINDSKDRFRTNAVSIGYGGVDVRLNMFTGDTGFSKSDVEPDYPNGVWNGGVADNFRLGALSLGYKGNRIGLNGEGIRHLFQNKFAHTGHKIGRLKILHNQTYFRHLGGGYKAYTETSTFSNSYSLWSF